MDFSEMIDLFKQGLFDIDCKEIVLEQNKAGGARFQGQGYIRQSEVGILTFKIYVSNVKNAEPFGHIKERLGGVPGKLHPDEMFYDLVAAGHDGTRWTAKRILPALHWDIADGGVLATGQVCTLNTRVPSSHPHPYLRLHFFEEYEVPLNRMTETERHGDRYMVRDRAEFEALGSRFEVRKHGNDTVLEVQSEKEFPAAFHLRVQEALQYVTAKPAIWRARLEVDGEDLCLELSSPLRKSVRTQFGPPIASVSSYFHECGWRLFACFLAYVIAKTEDTHWNPVAYHLHNACEATANSVDAWAVGYSVAVEAVAGLVVFEQDGEKAERVTKFQTRMRQWVATQTDFADLVPRLEGLIGALGEERVQDKLHTLVATGHVDLAYIKAWTRLRNRHVHPKLKELKKPDTVGMQELMDLIHQVEVLLRQLTFYLIGYTGPFTDYGVAGFPSRQYPLAPPEAPPVTQNSMS